MELSISRAKEKLLTLRVQSLSIKREFHDDGFGRELFLPQGASKMKINFQEKKR